MKRCCNDVSGRRSGRADLGYSPRIAPRVRRLASSFVLAACGVFAVAYVVAAWRFPGGTRAEPMRVGFSVLGNYWCDLLDARTYGGLDNPARPVALFAMIVLCAGLSALWCVAPTLTPMAWVRGRIVQVVGCVGGVVTPLIATRSLHDLAINVAGLFSATAFVLTVSAIGASAGRALQLFSWATLGLALANWLVWQTKVGTVALPGIQKLAFAAFLAWVVLLALRVRRGS